LRSANVPEDDFDKAILSLESPDEDSRTKSNDGMRIQRIEGGWKVLNYIKYRKHSYSGNPESSRKRNYRKKIKKAGHVPLCPENVRDISASASSSLSSSSFLLFWGKYPRKIARADALRIWTRIVEKENADPSEIIKAVDGYLADIDRLKTEPRYIKHPATFLNADRWRDYLPGSDASRIASPAKKDGMAATLEIIRQEESRRQS